MKVLIAVDGSEYTKRMLAYLSAHEDLLGPRHDYTVIHAVMAVPTRAAASLDHATLSSYYDDEAEKVFKPVRAFLSQQGIEARCLYEVGHAADVIVKAANQGDVDLIAMGSHGHGSLANLVMGSVATQVLAHCTRPVLLVR